MDLCLLCIMKENNMQLKRYAFGYCHLAAQMCVCVCACVCMCVCACV